jgi:hypothetical protein
MTNSRRLIELATRVSENAESASDRRKIVAELLFLAKFRSGGVTFKTLRDTNPVYAALDYLSGDIPGKSVAHRWGYSETQFRKIIQRNRAECESYMSAMNKGECRQLVRSAFKSRIRNFARDRKRIPVTK